jgi:hypothetical protein
MQKGHELISTHGFRLFLSYFISQNVAISSPNPRNTLVTGLSSPAPPSPQVLRLQKNSRKRQLVLDSQTFVSVSFSEIPFLLFQTARPLILFSTTIAVAKDELLNDQSCVNVKF